MELDFPILSDPDLELITALGLEHEDAASLGNPRLARPAVLFYDGEGLLKARILTDNWRKRARAGEILEKL